MMSKFTLTPIAAALLMAAAVNVPVMADSGIKEELTVAAGRQITPQDEATISSAAVKVLRHIAEARGNLQGDQPDTEKAKAELDKSEKLMDIIQTALPTTKVKDRIWVAKKHLEYEDSHEVLPDLVPIYASLDELVDYMPTARAKAHLDQAKQAMKEGDKATARDQLQATDDALLYVEADLPLNTTRQLVAQAQADLTRNDAQKADQALKSAEDNVVFISVSFQSPLTHAKAALWRAREDYGLGEKDYAKADLADSRGYLDAAVKRVAPEVRSRVEKVADLVGGLDKENDIRVNLDGRLFSISAATRGSAEQDMEEGTVMQSENFASTFQRAFTLPGPVDAAGMHSQYDDGVLTVTIPKATS